MRCYVPYLWKWRKVRRSDVTWKSSATSDLHRVSNSISLWQLILRSPSFIRLADELPWRPSMALMVDKSCQIDHGVAFSDMFVMSVFVEPTQASTMIAPQFSVFSRLNPTLSSPSLKMEANELLLVFCRFNVACYLSSKVSRSPHSCLCHQNSRHCSSFLENLLIPGNANIRGLW